MLHIHHSNRLETLAGELVSYKDNDTHPFTPRIIVTESLSLERWLRHQFCRNDGIACLLDTPLPAAWLWKQAHQMLDMPKGEDPLSRERMQWRIHAALDNDAPIRTSTGMEEISSYLKEDETGLKRWQLAERIADGFDRYQYYRPELIEKWSSGQDNQWQALLWREISKDIDTHRVAIMKRFHEALDTPEPGKLLGRLDLFAIHNLPRLILDAYAAVARHIPVHLWLLAPTPEYWADLGTPRQMARKRLEEPENALHWQAGNPLLTQWGRQGQVFQDLLLDYDVVAEEKDLFEEPATDSLLERIQADIHTAINDTDTPESISTDQPLHSIQIDVCHGPMRECQVLYDNLLRSLKHNESLEPEDILVMVPEISTYAPYIEAVFGQERGEGEQRLPYNLSDITLADEHPLTQTFLTLLELPNSRFTRPELLNLLHIPEVCQQFGLKETETGELAELFDTLRVYWGLDGADKKTRLNLPAIDENTWHQAFNRIMAGYALGDKTLYEGIAPISGMGAQRAELAARFFDLLQTLRNWSGELGHPATAYEWAERLHRFLNTLFGERADEEGRLQRIRDAISELVRLGRNINTPLSLAVIRHWFSNEISTQLGQGRPYSGGITFCSMQPLRGVPFKVICLLGMQDRAFPRRQSATEFDLMAAKWRHGDPNPAQEDRYLFLETVLAARERLLISYTGLDMRSNKERQSSVLVQEMLDYLDAHYTLDNKPLSATIVTKHPLQPFSSHNYGKPRNNTKSGNQKLPNSFDHWWLNIAGVVQQHKQPKKSEGWPKLELDLPDGFNRDITITQLTGFLVHPIRYFFKQRLKIFEPEALELVEDEPFCLDNLQQWQVHDTLLQEWLEDKSPEQNLLRAQGMLPHGTPGEILVDETRVLIEEYQQRLKPYRPLEAKPIDIQLSIATTDGWHLNGKILHHYRHRQGNGLLHITVSNFKPEKLIKPWVEHLCLQATQDHPGHSLIFCKNKTYILKSIDREQAHHQLATLAGWYEMGLRDPLPFRPKPANIFLSEVQKSNDKETALRKASPEFLKKFDGNTRETCFYMDLIHRHHQCPLNEQFQTMAEDLMQPIIDHLEELK